MNWDAPSAAGPRCARVSADRDRAAGFLRAVALLRPARPVRRHGVRRQSEGARGRRRAGRRIDRLRAGSAAARPASSIAIPATEKIRTDPALAWLVDYDKAVEAGLAVTMPIDRAICARRLRPGYRARREVLGLDCREQPRSSSACSRITSSPTASVSRRRARRPTTPPTFRPVCRPRSMPMSIRCSTRSMPRTCPMRPDHFEKPDGQRLAEALGVSTDLVRRWPKAEDCRHRRSPGDEPRPVARDAGPLPARVHEADGGRCLRRHHPRRVPDLRHRPRPAAGAARRPPALWRSDRPVRSALWSAGRIAARRACAGLPAASHAGAATPDQRFPRAVRPRRRGLPRRAIRSMRWCGSSACRRARSASRAARPSAIACRGTRSACVACQTFFRRRWFDILQTRRDQALAALGLTDPALGIAQAHLRRPRRRARRAGGRRRSRRAAVGDRAHPAVRRDDELSSAG